MRITTVETIRCAWYPRPVWVQLRTNDGIVGLGETTGAPGAVEAVIHGDLADLLLGADPADVEGLHAAIKARNRIWRTRDAATRALSAIDVALWDLVGQARGVPVWQVLGGKCRESIPVYNTCASAAYAVRRGESANRLSKPGTRAPSPQPSPKGRGDLDLSSPQTYPIGRGGIDLPSTEPSARGALELPSTPPSSKGRGDLDLPSPQTSPRGRGELDDDLQWFLSDAGSLAQSLARDGFTGMKIWPFDQFAPITGGHLISGDDIQRGTEPFRQIRDAMGDQMAVAAELHGVWSLPAAMRIVDALNDFDLMWVEDVTGAENIEALAQITRISRNPVAASESLATVEAYRELFDRAGVGVCMLDVCWVGGLTEAKAVARLSASHRIPLTPHDCTGPVNLMAGVHLSMNAPNAVVQETVRAFNREIYPRVVDRLPKIEGGLVHAPREPGLGMALLPEFLDDPRVTVRTTRK